MFKSLSLKNEKNFYSGVKEFIRSILFSGGLFFIYSNGMNDLLLMWLIHYFYLAKPGAHRRRKKEIPDHFLSKQGKNPR